MSQQSDRPNEQNPAEIARETIRQLGLRRIAPTPQAYRDIYEEIVGNTGQRDVREMLAAFAESVILSPALTDAGHHLRRAAEAEDWEEYGQQLVLLSEQLAQPAAAPGAPATAATGLATAASEQAGAPKLAAADIPAYSLRDMLARTLGFAVVSLLQNDAELRDETEQLAQAVKLVSSRGALEDIGARLKQLYFKIEIKSTDLSEQQTQLLRLFKLVLENIGELLEDDSWLRGQIAGVQNILAGPISHAALHDASRSLKEVIYKQGLLKHSLAEAKLTVKNMMITFIDRLSAVANTTGDYHEKMTAYSEKISQTTDIMALNKILGDVMRDTRSAQLEALRSRDEMLAARQQAHEAESRIHQLESQLEQMSELAREDQLTGSLNRRGLDDVFEREVARADRRKGQLCIALLDLDDFKRINDTHGHQAGDEALIHLVRVIKDTLRTMDVIGRFGGEEFMIVLPDTPLESALQTVTRVQRELTKRIFMHKHERVLITFSAGVALRKDGEDQQALFKRADDALYQAKHAGKNRVVAAE
ncbi:GGDEF domain-containing protein [Noviherbaspirillum sedimenti]|uniref:diguanylate cyclase n=2 Tax=Noviherbaspirillum sedimenti TaxID=2320865 RepID=A0A3A3G2U7_9BURK|nr:GGDEF domain-containing protein [Noviherbaspirillum sedimenti]